MSAWLLTGLALSIPFMGKPTHLACTFADAAEAPAIDVVIAPSHHAVAFTVQTTGHRETHPSTLSGATIAFDSPLPYGNVNYAIDRANLSIVRTEGGPSVATTIVKGQCHLEAAPALVF